ncbi:MAG: hypothetical protein L6R35_000185 [Caloplaca aegaea]|nr:MAG: hypothetical protein L6R35_000185 [Caloplaca aegaea]
MHRSSGLFFAAYKPASGFADQPKASKWDAVRWESLAQIHCWEENHDAEFVEARVTPTWNSMADCGKGVLGQGHGEVGSAPQNSLCQYLRAWCGSGDGPRGFVLLAGCQKQDNVNFAITDLLPELAKTQRMHTTSARDFQVALPLPCTE